MLYDLEKTKQLINKTGSFEEIVNVLQVILENLGFLEWAYFLQMLDSNAKASVFGFICLPRDWMENYLAKGYDKVDPITHYYINNNLPLIWDVNTDWSRWGDGAVALNSDLREFGFTGGVCIPLFTAQNTRGFLNIATREPSLGHLYEALNDKIPQAAFLMRYIHEAVFRVSLEFGLTTYRNPLTPREKEVLLWVGEGLTSKAIADRLGISFRTVEHHIAMIQKKMNVANRQQAVTKAVCLGFILPINLYQTPKDPVVKLIYADI